MAANTSTDVALNTPLPCNEKDDAPLPNPTQESKQQKADSRRKRLTFLLLFGPFVVGIVWHACHPFVSIFTGHTVPRRWFIDENSLDPSYFRMDAKYHMVKPRKSRGDRVVSLCDSLQEASYANLARLPCLKHRGRFEMVKIVPTASAIAPVSEAIVLVVPSGDHWMEGTQVRGSFLQLMSRLADPAMAPWLAKTILIVSPVHRLDETTLSLTQTVDDFLDCYLGNKDVGAETLTLWNGDSLPSDFTGAMIRNLIVVNVTISATGGEGVEVRILPQGRRGALPNMDLVFCAMVLYSRSPSVTRNAAGILVMHPYRQAVDEYMNSLKPWLSRPWQPAARSLLQFLAFEATLAVGPTPPHAGALDRGIDALTVEVILQFNNPQHRVSKTTTAEVVQVLEYVIRALSNLHERLHHSTSLYLLPSSDRFVKHEEYLVPCLLLLVPLLVRAVVLAFWDVPRFQLAAMGRAVLVTFGVTATVALGLEGVNQMADSEWSILDVRYSSGLVVAAVYLMFLLPCRLKVQERSSVQFVACLLAVVCHLPITFGHASLAFPSALFWTIILALTTFSRPKKWRFWRTVLGFFFSVSTFPTVMVVPRILPFFTTYVTYLYIPLHVLYCLLCLSTE